MKYFLNYKLFLFVQNSTNLKQFSRSENTSMKWLFLNLGKIIFFMFLKKKIGEKEVIWLLITLIKLHLNTFATTQTRATTDFLLN